MEQVEHPLMVEYHEGYQDVYISRGLPGTLSRRDLYFYLILLLFVLVFQIIQGTSKFVDYLISTGVLLVLFGVYKGLKVGIDSINYTPYKLPLLTRMADDFIIWSRDNPIAIEDTMEVAVRPSTQAIAGVVYLYTEEKRHITFIADEDHYLETFAEILMGKYHLNRRDNVTE